MRLSLTRFSIVVLSLEQKKYYLLWQSLVEMINGRINDQLIQVPCLICDLNRTAFEIFRITNQIDRFVSFWFLHI